MKGCVSKGFNLALNYFDMNYSKELGKEVSGLKARFDLWSRPGFCYQYGRLGRHF